MSISRIKYSQSFQVGLLGICDIFVSLFINFSIFQTAYTNHILLSKKGIFNFYTAHDLKM